VLVQAALDRAWHSSPNLEREAAELGARHAAEKGEPRGPLDAIRGPLNLPPDIDAAPQ
jgi:hypothetical protein